ANKVPGVTNSEKKDQPAESPMERKAGNDRKAAEWVLSNGGNVWVRVGDNEQRIESVKDLPASVQLATVNLQHNKEISDTGLKNLEGVNLRSLSLFACSSPNFDAALEPVGTLTTLDSLTLYATPVSDAGLKHIDKLSRLRLLSLGRTRVGDPGL